MRMSNSATISGYSAANVGYRRLVNAKQIRQGRLVSGGIADHFNLLGSELRAVMCCPSGGDREATALDAVLRIFLVGPYFKVFRIAARRVVAFVANNKAIWNRAMFERPGKPMASVTDSVPAELTVAIVTSGPLPLPTFATLANGDVFPKRRLGLRSVHWSNLPQGSSCVQ